MIASPVVEPGPETMLTTPSGKPAACTWAHAKGGGHNSPITPAEITRVKAYQLSDPQGGQRSLLSWLQHNSVAAGQRRAELSGNSNEGEIPRDDEATNSPAGGKIRVRIQQLTSIDLLRMRCTHTGSWTVWQVWAGPMGTVLPATNQHAVGHRKNPTRKRAN